eukprot:TRINITY_DN64289_c0_g1_i1.p1 TRINITY_DN64289_c0_g1~~TRINITY_DN64289_c0_g1_i1.p1  ORF type:complete len:116 (+),score=5.97 TRINITY_DN64289_c0_g1_i1:211-558(+)
MAIAAKSHMSLRPLVCWANSVSASATLALAPLADYMACLPRFAAPLARPEREPYMKLSPMLAGMFKIYFSKYCNSFNSSCITSSTIPEGHGGPRGPGGLPLLEALSDQQALVRQK